MEATINTSQAIAQPLAQPAAPSLRPIKARQGHLISDSYAMFKRCIRINFRNPDAFGMSIVAPFLMMLLLGYVFGGAMAMGRETYINFIVPSIMLISIAQSTIFTGISVSKEAKNGIIDRFRSMPIAQSSVLVGHVAASMFRSIVVMLAVTAGAFIIGFRPEASAVQWLTIAGLLLLFTLGMTWIAVLVGLTVKSEEAASSSLTMVSLLPYLSSGFAPVETLPAGLRAFAQYQPITPVIDNARALMMGGSISADFAAAILWWSAIAAIACLVAIKTYHRKLTK
ncbi:MAG: ABC transporter permease [Coriobacteriia bacterium]|nr:ABC transporter permease [Coriobacteriia bacterium]